MGGDHEQVARRLGEAVAAIGLVKLRFSRFGRFDKTAFLQPECEEDPGLKKLYAACVAAVPEIAQSCHSFVPHLTVGQFKRKVDCTAFLNNNAPLEFEIEISCLSLLGRDTMTNAFRTPFRVRLDAVGQVEIG